MLSDRESRRILAQEKESRGVSSTLAGLWIGRDAAHRGRRRARRKR